MEEAAYFSQSASTAFGCRGAYAIRALRDLRLGIKSESLERVKWHDTLWKAPAHPGLSFAVVYRQVPNQA